jgi:uncharacterized protein (TIGR03435 family)
VRHGQGASAAVALLGPAEARGGLKLKPTDPDQPKQRMMDSPNGAVMASSRQGKGLYTAVSTSMADFANWLHLQVDRPVLDMTGIQGNFAVDLRWEPEGLPQAVERIMGPKLNARKMSFDVLVIDRVLKTPTEN